MATIQDLVNNGTNTIYIDWGGVETEVGFPIHQDLKDFYSKKQVLIYSFTGFPLYHMIIRKNTTLYKHLIRLRFDLKDSNIKGHVYVNNNEGYLLTATNYRYVVDENDDLNEWLDFSIIRPDATVTDTLLYVPVDQFSISVDSYHFGNLINYQNWRSQQKVLDIAKRYMNP